MVAVLAFVSLALVAGAVALGDRHPIPGGTLMALALVSALVARGVDAARRARIPR